MYIKINQNGTQQYPYSFLQLKNDNSQVSFPSVPTNELLAEWGMFPVVETQLQFDEAIQRYEEAMPTLIDGVWTQTWNIIELTAEELAQREAKRLATLEGERAYAYRTESDPLFFKAQRGEATMQEWLDKVAEIKARSA